MKWNKVKFSSISSALFTKIKNIILFTKILFSTLGTYFTVDVHQAPLEFAVALPGVVENFRRISPTATQQFAVVNSWWRTTTLATVCSCVKRKLSKIFFMKIFEAYPTSQGECSSHSSWDSVAKKLNPNSLVSKVPCLLDLFWESKLIADYSYSIDEAYDLPLNH